MAYDEELADRVRNALASRSEVSERKMFGGIAFMIEGNMAVGVMGEELMVRLGPDEAPRALEEPHTRVMDFTGRPMKGFVIVEVQAIAKYKVDELELFLEMMRVGNEIERRHIERVREGG